MTVTLLPPISYGVGRYDADPLAEGPRYVRTGGMSRWHRPRSGVQYPDARTVYTVWCGQHVGGLCRAATTLTADTVTDGLPVCATCDGRAVGAGQEPDGPAGRTLTFGPRDITPPRHCPGSRTPLFEAMPGNTTGRCLACQDVHPTRAMGGPYAPRHAITQHRPGARLFAPCPFHAWRHPRLNEGRLACVCGRPLTAPQ
ncbi:hypothetical protein ACIO8F_08120 [Streptomyces sp. NPDC087228]|uniref:hypothetical protein n=1 Tax=Streptomyces sp. NPDC087228 TaxID=3365772 RepID=UPI003818AA1C